MSTVADIEVVRRSEAPKSGAASQPPPHPIAAKNARRSMVGKLTPKSRTRELDAGPSGPSVAEFLKTPVTKNNSFLADLKIFRGINSFLLLQNIAFSCEANDFSKHLLQFSFIHNFLGGLLQYPHQEPLDIFDTSDILFLIS